MRAMVSQITSLVIVRSTVYLGADERKYQSSASLAFVRGIHRWPVNSPHKGPVTRKMFPFDDVVMKSRQSYLPVGIFSIGPRQTSTSWWVENKMTYMSETAFPNALIARTFVNLISNSLTVQLAMSQPNCFKLWLGGRRTGDKPFSEPSMVKFTYEKNVNRRHWFKSMMK